MQPNVQDLALTILLGTVVVLLLTFFIVMFLFFFRQKQVRHEAELTLLHETHRREILTAQLETQNQILQQVAEDLHDHVGQMLSVVWLHLNCLHEDTQHTPFYQPITDVLEHTATLITDVRNLSKLLNTDTIARFGLQACLDMELSRINRAGSTPKATMHVLGEPYSMGQQTEIILLRMVQEALNNALKHAPGAPISVHLDFQDDRLVVLVIDQGPGFQLGLVEDRPSIQAGQGLHNLRRRASLLRGECNWQEAPQHKGTCVCMTIPRSNTLETALPVSR